MISRILILVFLCSNAITYLHAQTIRHPQKITNADCKNCNSKHNWIDITDESLLNSSPYNNIFHLSFKRKNDIIHYGTTSFVSKDLLITARHCVHDQANLEYLELSLPGFKNKWVKLNRSDYRIYYYSEKFSDLNKDIALIRITNKQKLKQLYTGHFEIGNTQINREEKYEVNFSGFPFIKFSINSTAPDTLVNRTLPSDLLEFNPSNTMMGAPACICSGDSGGPIWRKYKNSYYILGVHQGSKSTEAGFANPNLNISVSINDSIAKWITSIISSNI